MKSEFLKRLGVCTREVTKARQSVAGTLRVFNNIMACLEPLPRDLMPDNTLYDADGMPCDDAGAPLDLSSAARRGKEAAANASMCACATCESTAQKLVTEVSSTLRATRDFRVRRSALAVYAHFSTLNIFAQHVGDVAFDAFTSLLEQARTNGIVGVGAHASDAQSACRLSCGFENAVFCIACDLLCVSAHARAEAKRRGTAMERLLCALVAALERPYTEIPREMLSVRGRLLFMLGKHARLAPAQYERVVVAVLNLSMYARVAEAEHALDHTCETCARRSARNGGGGGLMCAHCCEGDIDSILMTCCSIVTVLTNGVLDVPSVHALSQARRIVACVPPEDLDALESEFGGTIVFSYLGVPQTTAAESSDTMESQQQQRLWTCSDLALALIACRPSVRCMRLAISVLLLLCIGRCSAPHGVRVESARTLCGAASYAAQLCPESAAFVGIAREAKRLLARTERNAPSCDSMLSDMQRIVTQLFREDRVELEARISAIEARSQ